MDRRYMEIMETAGTLVGFVDVMRAHFVALDDAWLRSEHVGQCDEAAAAIDCLLAQVRTVLALDAYGCLKQDATVVQDEPMARQMSILELIDAQPREDL